MLDRVVIEVIAGNGGKGAVSFRREKFVPQGGPDGGKGGRGGHVIIVANDQINTLARYRRGKRFRAAAGQPGGTNRKKGRDGEDLILEVPAGTIVHRRDPLQQESVDLAKGGAGVIVAQGGRGGQGNTFFKSAVNRAPRVAQRGQQGEEGRISLEMRLIADVGIVGLPNAGKSTLLGQLSEARPRVGAYPFTTLEPGLGVVQIGWSEFVVADLPGLPIGAARGAGLGHDFLRHTGRTSLLIHLIDGTEPDPWKAHNAINTELSSYSSTLAEKRQVVVINKIDRDEVRAMERDTKTTFARNGISPLFISAETGEGTAGLIQQCWTALEHERVKEGEGNGQELALIRPAPDRRRFNVVPEDDGALRVNGPQVEAFVGMMDLDDAAAMDEVYRWLGRRGVIAALKNAGLKDGDTIRVGRHEWRWQV